METRKLIMIVDDEDVNRDLLEILLKDLGYAVDPCKSGAEALQKLRRTHDLVMLDLRMPGMDGFELATRIRNDSAAPDVPICMVTAMGGKEERLRAVKAEVNDFITKPYDAAELQVRTASLLKMREGQDAIREYLAKLESQNDLLEENLAELRKLRARDEALTALATDKLSAPLRRLRELSKTLAGPAAQEIETKCAAMQQAIANIIGPDTVQDAEAASGNDAASPTHDGDTLKIEIPLLGEIESS